MQRAQIIRMEHYLMRLGELRDAGITHTTSDGLASVVGVSGSRVRQDMMAIEITGRPNAGYVVAEMESRIRDALNLVGAKGMALVGCGNLGRALVNSGLWGNAGFTLRAIFDSNPDLVGQRVGGLKVQHTSRLRRVIQNQQVIAGCVAVPPEAAQEVVDALVEAGVTGIWNFASTDVHVPPSVVIENQHLDHGLMTLSYFMSKKTAGRSGPVDP